jgi:Tol biopolymer transport system component
MAGREADATASSANRLVRVLLRWTAFTVVAAFVTVWAVTDASAADLSAGGKLVLAGHSLDPAESGRVGLYVINGDGSGLRQITHSSTDGQAHWSPDGRSIAFVRRIGSFFDVEVVRGDGSGRRVVGVASIPGGLTAPDPWSPDGKRLAWAGCGGVCVFDFRSARRTAISLRVLPRGQRGTSGFSWSPDGRKLVAVDGYGRLVVVDAAGAMLSVLPATGTYPAWSPDGSEIAFLVDGKLKLAPVAGSRPHVVARNAWFDGPTWSPDGRRLLYTSVVRGDAAGSGVRVLNVATHTNTRIEDGATGHWSPDGSMIAFRRLPTPVEFTVGDVWIADGAGGGVRELTGEFPSGLGYVPLDWSSGSVPAGPPVAPTDLYPLPAASELDLADYDFGIGRAGTPDSVLYRTDTLCDPNALTASTNFDVWTPSTEQTATTSTGCLDWDVLRYALTANLAAWTSPADIEGNDSLDVIRTGSAGTPATAHWTSGQQAPDIGWRVSIGPVVSDGSTILFETDNTDTMQLWRIADSGTLHAVSVPLPINATGLLDTDAGRIVVQTGKTSLAVISSDGAILARIPVPANAGVRLGGSLLGVATRTTLSVYDAGTGALAYQLPLAGASGVPRLLTIGAGYAVYTSGIELHLLRLDDGNDRIVDLPGQDGQAPQALLTTEGLFVAYVRGYDPQPGRILFVPAANLP